MAPQTNQPKFKLTFPQIKYLDIYVLKYTKLMENIKQYIYEEIFHVYE